MSEKPESVRKTSITTDNIDRRGFLKCMAWVGTGVLWTVRGGMLSSTTFAAEAADASAKGDFSFVQISDSHIGFSKAPNKDVAGTLQLAIDRINAMKVRPELLIHTGDLTHMSEAVEFDAVDKIVSGAKVGHKLYVPGEHDMMDAATAYQDRFGKNAKGTGWHSYDHRGVHFIGLVNVVDTKPGGLGVLGQDQLDWLKKDVESLGASTPIVVFAHVPLWSVFPKWGWGTQDSEQALSILKRFGSVTVLNGHIHQVLQKTEGHVTFHTACSTAFPQPEPGKAENPGPIKTLAADKLKHMLGLTTVNYLEGTGSLATVDSTLE